MDILLKSKWLWQYTKVSIANPTYVNAKFILKENKDEDVGVIMNYILREIHFHTSGIDCAHIVKNKLKSLFNTVNESQVVKIEKELISLEPLSFGRIED